MAFSLTYAIVLLASAAGYTEAAVAIGLSSTSSSKCILIYFWACNIKDMLVFWCSFLLNLRCIFVAFSSDLDKIFFNAIAKTVFIVMLSNVKHGKFIFLTPHDR